jgi:hypothetical protein
MREVLTALRDARDYLDCYKHEPGIKGHGAYYCVEKAIKALEKEKFVFPDDKDRGMALRDYFAGQVLAQIISRDNDPKRFVRDNAATAYLYADAMLAEREKE